MKEKRQQSSAVGSSSAANEVFSIYKLKQKVMNEKIEKIKLQFVKQNSNVENIKTLFDDNLAKIQFEINTLKEVGSIENGNL